MSIENNLRVASAKAKGDIATLMQMAGQGDITAAAALKQLKDKQDYMKSLQRNTGIQGMAATGGEQMDSQNSVIANLAQSMEMPEQTTGIDPSQSGIGQVAQENPENSYAEGGAVRPNFEAIPTGGSGDGPTPGATTRDSEWERNLFNTLSALPGASALSGLGAGISKGARMVTPLLSKMFSNSGEAQAAGIPAGAGEAALPKATDPEARRKRQLGDAGKTPKATGIAAATDTPGEGAASASGPGARLAVPKPGTAAGIAAANADTPLTDAEKQIAALAALSEEGRQLTAAQQKMLDDAHAAYTKRGAGSTWSKVMDFANRLSASKGSDNLSVFGEAGRGMREADKAKGEMDAKQQQAYESATLLLKQADLAARKGDVNAAAKLRADAKELMGKQESERTLNEYRKALAEAAKDRGDAAVTTANRPRATKAAATGVKPMTEAQRVAALDKLVKGGMTEEQAAQVLARRTTMPGNVTPDATTGKAKFLGFE